MRYTFDTNDDIAHTLERRSMKRSFLRMVLRWILWSFAVLTVLGIIVVWAAQKADKARLIQQHRNGESNYNFSEETDKYNEESRLPGAVRANSPPRTNPAVAKPSGTPSPEATPSNGEPTPTSVVP